MGAETGSATPGPPEPSPEEYWGNAAEGWIRQRAAVDRMLGELTDWALEAAEFHAGETVVDLGCGCGTTSLEIARRVGPEGRVRAFDLSGPMLEHARERAAEAGLANLDFQALDVQTGDLGAGADAAFSRFGVMFFGDPTAAFANIRSALRPGGRLHFLAWSDLSRNPYFKATLGRTSRRLELPMPGIGEPGPFGLADGRRILRILEDAGFEDVQIDAWSARLHLASAQEACRTQWDLSARLRPQLDALAPEERQALEQEIVGALERYGGDEGLEVPAGVWWVSARR